MAVFPLDFWYVLINSQPTFTCLTGRPYGIASNNRGGPPQLQQACLWAAAPHKNTQRASCTISAYISSSPFQTLSWVSFLLHAIWILKNQAQHVTTCLCCFCFQGVDLLLLLFCCSIWWRTLRLSTGRTWKNIEARKTQMHLKCSRNRNCDKLESRKLGSQFQQIETARKRQKAPGFQRLCLSVAVPHTRWNQNESKWTKMNQKAILLVLQTCLSTSYEAARTKMNQNLNQNEPKAIILVLQTCLFLKGCKTISCYFTLFHQTATCLQRGLAVQVLQLLSMLFSSSSRRWGMLCLPSKRSFEKSWNIVRRPIDIDMN